MLRFRKIDAYRKCSNKNLKCDFEIQTTNIGEKLKSQLMYDYRQKNDLKFFAKYGENYNVDGMTEGNSGNLVVDTPDQKVSAKIFGIFENLESNDPKSVDISYDGQALDLIIIIIKKPQFCAQNFVFLGTKLSILGIKQ